jgi:hypothetical protein
MTQLPLPELEARARQLTRHALEGRSIPERYRADVTLGTFFEADAIVFCLYVAREPPDDAIVLTRAVMDPETGDGRVEVFDARFDA